jgi:hypothetical protein
MQKQFIPIFGPPPPQTYRFNQLWKWYEMLDDTLDCSILSTRVTTLKDDQHLVAMFDDILLHFHELNLQLSKRCFVRRMAARITVFFSAF